MRRALAPLALSALLAGCIELAPGYHRPPMPTPAAFPTGPAYPPAGPAQPAVGWRDFFSDPKLSTVIEQALANNRDLRVAVANVAVARAQYHVQRAYLFPTIDATASATYLHEPASVVGGGAFPGAGSGAFNEKLFSLTAGTSAYQLDLFGKVRDLSRAAQARYFATRQARDAAQISLVSEVAADYLALGADRAQLAIAEDTLKSGEASLDLVRRRFGVGVDSQLDLSQADTIVQQSRFDVARLTTQIAQDRNALDLVVGAPVADDLLPTDAGAPVVVLARLPSALNSRVLLARPDVLEAEDQVRADNLDIGAARAAFFPSIGLTGDGGLTSTALSALFRGASATWGFAPTVSQTLIDAGINRGNLDVAKAQRDIGVATYEKAIQTAFREVADALAQRGTIDQQLIAQQSLTDAAATSMRIYGARYQQGSDTYQNFLIAERSYYAARQTLVATELARQTNLVTLYAVLGGGLDRPAPAPPDGTDPAARPR
ncbi:MAG TPA: efflux transporter outer membrane subunit [Caulobacteraceae bacterium]|jgi:multidrug efflux system outer membrane protein|nr:efflux transporter outer membrane subunit [Caulobacteraceae bacterium]